MNAAPTRWASSVIVSACRRPDVVRAQSAARAAGSSRARPQDPTRTCTTGPGVPSPVTSNGAARKRVADEVADREVRVERAGTGRRTRSSARSSDADALSGVDRAEHLGGALALRLTPVPAFVGSGPPRVVFGHVRQSPEAGARRPRRSSSAGSGARPSGAQTPARGASLRQSCRTPAADPADVTGGAHRGRMDDVRERVRPRVRMSGRRRRAA